MSLAWLLDPQHQIITKSGTINVGGKIRIFDAATDDPVVTYKDFMGTANTEAVALDNNGRACIIADSERAYRVEVYDRYGTLMWTVTPVWCIGTAAGTDNMVNIMSSDGTVKVVKTSSGGITNYDLSIIPDELDPSVIVAQSATIEADGNFQFTGTPIAQLGDDFEIINDQITAKVGWYHFDTTVAVTYAGTPVNQETPVTVTGPDTSESLSFDQSYSHSEYITVEGDFEIQENWTPIYFAIQGLGESMSAKVVNVSIHEILKEAGGGLKQVNADWDATSGVAAILNKPTIPSGAQLVPAATSADADKVLTVNDQGTPAWAPAQAPISAGDGVDITNNVVSAKVDGTSVTFNANGELEAITAPQVNADWDATSGVAEILHKPTIPVVPAMKDLVAGSNVTITESSNSVTISAAGAAQVNADWDATSGVAEILNKPTIPVVPAMKDLVAGSGVTITEGSSSVTISATGTTYTAGTGIAIQRGVISADTTVLALKSELNVIGTVTL